MPRKYAIEYIDRLLADTTYDALAELSSVICSGEQFDNSQPAFGLPRFAFLFVETLLWFAQAQRSGVWTYYEATSQARQQAMLEAVRAAPEGFATWYEQGMRDWKDETRIDAVDKWMEANDDAAHAWLRTLATTNRDALLDLTR